MCTKNCNYWGMVPDIQNETQIFLSFWAIFCPFTPLTTHKIKILKNEKSICRSYHFTRMYQKLRSYLWFLRYKARQTVFCHFGSFFAFDPPNNPKNQNLEKIKIRPGDIIVLHLCTTNDSHMMYGSWDMEHRRQNFLSLWTIFCPFTPLTSWKIKIMRKWKNKKQTNKHTWRYYLFTHV